jgi:predicted alpha/beta hydrolase family esterase
MTSNKDYSTELACALNGYRALIVPDIQNNEVPHWQSLWERTIPRTSRIRLHDWHTADWVKWHNSIIASLIAIDEPVVLIAEGFGALAAASVAAEYPGKVIAAFLVDPADPDQFDVRKKIPKQALPVATSIIISEKNRAQDNAKTAFLALMWGTDFLTANTLEPAIEAAPSDYWPEGIQELNKLVSKTQRSFKETSRARARKLPSIMSSHRQILALGYN